MHCLRPLLTEKNTDMHINDGIHIASKIISPSAKFTVQMHTFRIKAPTFLWNIPANAISKLKV